MDPERWRLVDRIFESALALPAEQRAALLARECDGDDELRREVESLLAHDGGDDSLEAGAAREAAGLLLRGATPREGLFGRTLGRFEVEARLGSGGMGEVYRARDPRLGRLVALKLIPAHLSAEPERRRRFRREALATSALNHPNIVTVYEILELAERDVLVTELVDGVTLEEHASAGLPPATALGIGIQIARALAAAHALGVEPEISGSCHAPPASATKAGKPRPIPSHASSACAASSAVVSRRARTASRYRSS
ncbi:MAG TPA: protein kinase [Thermoanaerobaculia bacterium]|nr:protein kinase [Thermoanaerobaculia bacterium]